MIIGIDEVGRGSWAGPLVIGAVVLDDSYSIVGLNDSKLLTRSQREQLIDTLTKFGRVFSSGWVDNNTIDRYGLTIATKIAILNALEKISVNVAIDKIIIDGNINYLKDTSYEGDVLVMKKADSLVPCVSAASILAKVVRDRYMFHMSEKYPEYDFKNNVGYGTKTHIDAIKRYGTTPIHRLSYKPLKILS
jgi:ribonuclease HII